MKFTTKMRLALLATVATATFVQPAMALDAQAFVDRIASLCGTMGYVVEPGPVSASGDTVTVKGVKIGINGEAPVAMDTELTFSGVTEQADGSYTATSLTMPDFEYDIAEKVPGHISLKNISVDGLYVPATDALTYAASMQAFASASAGPISVTRNGAEVLSVQSISTTNTFSPAQGSASLTDVASEFYLEGFAADLSSVGEEDPAAGAVIDALGFTNVSGDISESMSWSIADGHIVLDQLLIDIADQGSLDIGADVTGFTPAVMDMIYSAQNASADKTKSAEEIDQANAMMGMQIMSSVSVNSASVRYDDAALAPALLAYFASQQGIEPAQLVESLKAMVPATLAGFGMPALTAIVEPAVSAFLEDPQSLEVAINPATPTNGMMLMGAAANPDGLVKMLDLTVTANEAAD